MALFIPNDTPFRAAYNAPTEQKTRQFGTTRARTVSGMGASIKKEIPLSTAIPAHERPLGKAVNPLTGWEDDE